MKRSRGRFAMRRKRAWTSPISTSPNCKGFSPSIEADALQKLSLEGSLAARDHIGGTAPEQVRAAIARARADLASG